MENTPTIENQQVTESAFSLQTFEHAQRVAKMLASSSLIPKAYQGNIQNVMVALEMANRIGASPLMVMQNLHIIQGNISWSSTFIISAINSCGRFEPLRFDLTGEGDRMKCIAWTNEKGKMERIEGPAVTMTMAKQEGWIDKNGSKWKTMPELMIRYRAAAFFGRLYAPEILMGMQTMEEVIDIDPVQTVHVDKEAERVVLMIQDAKTLDELKAVEPHLKDGQLDLYTVKKDELTVNKR